MKKEMLKILSPTAILGYGYPVESFMAGMAEKPDVVGIDAGSVDPGPYYLGSGKSFTDRTGVKRDLRYILREAVPAGIPVIIGTAGGSGAKPHLEWCRQIIMELAQEEKLSFKMGMVSADIDKEAVVESIRSGETEALDDLPELTEKTVAEAERIVAQMGPGPIIRALKKKCNVVLAGRAYDPAVFSALPIMEGFDEGLATHMGKILECAAIAADPGSGADCVLGILKKDSFILKPLNPKRRFTASSTAAHSLYEKADPYRLPGPGGLLDLTNVKFKELSDGMVEVSGSRFVKSEKNMIKLEGVHKVGFRTVSIAGVRDSIMISKISSIIDDVKKQVENILKNENIDSQIFFHIYGRNGVMDSWEKATNLPHEIGIVIEVLAPSQQEADTVCSITRSTLLHFGYQDRIATAGNLAFPFSPSDMKCGEVYEFSIYHLMPVKDEEKLFRLKTTMVKGKIS